MGSVVRRRAVAAAASLALGVAVFATTTGAADAAEPSSDEITEVLTVEITDLATGVTSAYESVDGAPLQSDVTPDSVGCSPGTKALTATITGSSSVEGTIYKFHHDITFSYDCTNIKAIWGQQAYPSDVRSWLGWEWKGYSVPPKKSGAGKSYGTAIAGGHFARCYPFAGFEACQTHQYPTIQYTLRGTGAWSAQKVSG